MYEQGRREPAAEILVALSQIFGVSTDYLLTGAPGSSGEQKLARQAALQNLAEMETAMLRRRNRPFSQNELTVLLAAMMLEP
jgi:transcriptional regulator with XRE-family HTH domain